MQYILFSGLYTIKVSLEFNPLMSVCFKCNHSSFYNFSVIVAIWSVELCHYSLISLHTLIFYKMTFLLHNVTDSSASKLILLFVVCQYGFHFLDKWQYNAEWYPNFERDFHKNQDPVSFQTSFLFESCTSGNYVAIDNSWMTEKLPPSQPPIVYHPSSDLCAMLGWRTKGIRNINHLSPVHDLL